MSTSLLALKATNAAKENVERTQEERRRNILVLMIDSLGRNGFEFLETLKFEINSEFPIPNSNLSRSYVDSCQRLQGESGMSQTKWEVADNMDLSQIIVQFEEYYVALCSSSDQRFSQPLKVQLVCCL